MPARLIIRLLGALAPPLILLAVIQALMHARIRGRQAARLGFLLLLNTTVAIVIGLAVANTCGPAATPRAGAAGRAQAGRRTRSSSSSTTSPTASSSRWWTTT